MKTLKVNEQTYRFEFPQPIAEAEFSILSAQQAAFSPLAKKLFGFPWTESIAVFPQAIELTKKDWVDWDVLLEPLEGLLTEHVSMSSALEKAPEVKKQDTSSDEAQTIQSFIESAINPSLAMHGGFIQLHTFENQTAFLRMGGGCQGCASSQATMFDGVETALKEQFPFVQKVVDVTDHASGENPYYNET